MKLLKLCPLILAIILSGAVLAKVTTSESTLLPGITTVAGDPKENEFFIVLENEVAKLKKTLHEAALRIEKKTQLKKVLHEPILRTASKEKKTILPKAPLSHHSMLAHATIKNIAKMQKNVTHTLRPLMQKNHIKGVRVVLKKPHIKNKVNWMRVSRARNHSAQRNINSKPILRMKLALRQTRHKTYSNS